MLRLSPATFVAHPYPTPYFKLHSISITVYSAK
jgi:hypothetical protein